MTVPSHRQIETNVPRYTSYPTAPHFHAGVDAATAEGWIERIPAGEPISLYLHIPFCDRLCWFCACHTKQTLRYEPVAAYLRSLHDEIRTFGRMLAGRGRVHAIHMGGGSPTLLRPRDLIRLRQEIDDAFNGAATAALSVEIDPNDMDDARLDGLADAGLTRASLGIQDFDPRVQKAINREQGFDVTAAVVEGLRERGVGSVNLDLLYGLPHQTLGTLSATIAASLTLRPDRVAIFGYAHVPWFKKHQTMIEDAALPDADERLDQAGLAGRLLRAAGYEAIGIDHFALPDDSLSIAAREGRLHRNFQGYTDDSCQTLIGLGASSVSRFRQGYTQNVTATGEYRRAVSSGRPATARGVELAPDDLARGWVIERLMCDFRFRVSTAAERFGAAADAVLAEAALLVQQGLLERSDDAFIVPEGERLGVRLIAARFDRHLDRNGARYSRAV